MVKYFRRFDSLIGQGLIIFFKDFFLQKDVLKAVTFFCGYDFNQGENGRENFNLPVSCTHPAVKVVRGVKHLADLHPNGISAYTCSLFFMNQQVHFLLVLYFLH